MKCTEYRDLSELLVDGALGAAEAAAARDHRAGCDACRAFEDGCAVLLAPLHGFPPGPYLPPTPPGRLPPWATGSALGVLLAVLLAGGAAAWALRGTGRPPLPATGRTETARAPGPAPRPAPPSPEPPPPAPAAEGEEVVLRGRVIAVPGRRPVAGAVLRIDGLPPVTTDAGGVFTVPRYPAGASRLLRLEPPGGPASEALLPSLEPGPIHTLGDLLVGPPSPATVRVIRWDARPAAGVVVRACRLAPTVHPYGDSDIRPGTRGEFLPALATARTNAEGVAEFEELNPGRWTVQAERDGVPFSRPADLDVLDDPDLSATLFLDAATPFEGRVLDDATGTPVAGARVQWSRIGPRVWPEDIREYGLATTDSGGRYRFPMAPVGPMVLQVRRPGAPVASGYLGVDSSRVDRADIRLAPAGAFAGVCIEAGTGLPAAGAVVCVSAALRDGVCQSRTCSYVRAGPDGRFEARGIPGNAIVTADLQPHSSWCDPGPLLSDQFLVGTSTRIEAYRTGSVEGEVRDAGGRPVPGWPVVAIELLHRDEDFPAGAIRVAQSYTDPRGRFLLENLPPGRAALFAPAPEDLSSLALELEASRALDAQDPPPFVVTVPLPSGPRPILAVRGRDFAPITPDAESRTNRIGGTVLDLAGAPVAGTTLWVMRSDLSGMLRERRSSTFLWFPIGEPVPVAPDGRFVAEVHRSAGRGIRFDAFTLLAMSPTHPPAFAVARFKGAEEVEGVQVVFEDGCSLRGRVLHDDGTPAAGALLEAVPQALKRPVGSNVMVRGRTAEDGSFRLDGLFPGTHILTVGRGPGPVHRVVGLEVGGDPIEVRLPPGDGAPPDPPFTFRRGSGPHGGDRIDTLKGRVEGLNYGFVEAFDPATPGARIFSTLVEPTGRFECPVPPRGRFAVAASGDKGRWLYVDDLATGTPDIVLRPEGPSTGLLRGRVVTPAGAAAAGVPVHAVRLRGEGESALPPEVRLDGRAWAGWNPYGNLVPRVVRTTLTGGDGSFDLGSPPGRWAVFAGLPGSEDIASAASVPWSASDPRVLEVPLAAGRVLRVRATGFDPARGSPAAGAEVRLEGFLPGTAGPTLTVRMAPGPAGLVEFRGLPPGRVVVLLLDESRREIGRATAEPGEDRDPPVAIPVTR